MVEIREPGTSPEVRKVDDEGAADHRSSRVLDEPHRRLGSSARRDQVVDDQDPIAFAHGVLVYFDPIGAVFELVVLANRLPGKFPFLAHGYKPDA